MSTETGELQCLRETMDVLRHERDVLQNELMRRQQQLKLERHLLREKFAIEKEILIKEWQAKVTSASEANKSDGQQASQPSGKTLISATAEAMVNLCFMSLLFIESAPTLFKKYNYVINTFLL